MKTLILNGSPRKNGDTVTLINKMVENLDGEMYQFSAYHDNISPCVDCRYCWEHEGCIIDDKMQQIYRLLNQADNVILASPIYYSGLTGSILAMLSRLQVYYAERVLRGNNDFKLKKKYGVVILVGGGDGSHAPALKTAKILLRQMNVELIDTVESLNTNNKPAKEDDVALDKAREVSIKLNNINRG